MKRDWYVLQTKPRAEKKVAQWLEFYKYFCHLPLTLHVRKSKTQRRKIKTLLPLFPGYVFTKLMPDERITMLKTNLIVKTIAVQHPRQMIHQLRQIKNATRHSPEVKVTHNFQNGELVRITAGPMRGIEGYVKREGPNATLCINVDILSSTVEVAVSPADLESVSASQGKA